jgi:hypothetical protein
MEDGKELIEIGPAEREKCKSTVFEKRETTSKDDESSQNKRRSGEGTEKSVPADPGETPNLQ